MSLVFSGFYFVPHRAINIWHHVLCYLPNIYLKQFETTLFPQDMIQDIYKLHWNIIHKSTGVT